MRQACEPQMTVESGSRQTVVPRRRAARAEPSDGQELAPALPRFARDMTDETFARYFAEREQFERAMSERAKRVAEVHGDMAQRYEALAKVFGARR